MIVNKKLSIVLAILYGIIVIGLIVGLVLLISSDFSFKNFGGGSMKLIDNKEFDNINKLNINVKTADVYIKTSSDEKIKVEVYSAREEKSTINNTDESLNITLDQGVCSFFCWFRKNSKINVYLPNNYANDITVKASTGDIEIDDFANSNAYITVTTGDVKLNGIKTADIKATTGDITVIKVDDITASLSTGDVVINNINNYLNLSTSTGDITISNANLKKNSNISTSTGDVKISTLNDIYVETKTSTGDSRINNNNRKSDIELKIKTSTGDINVN